MGRSTSAQTFVGELGWAWVATTVGLSSIGLHGLRTQFVIETGLAPLVSLLAATPSVYKPGDGTRYRAHKPHEQLELP